MCSVLWLLLILSASGVSSDESGSQSDQSVTPIKPRSPAFKWADDIYKKQKECESIIGETVDKVLDDGVYNNLPVPDERYLQCKRTLEEQKKGYINTALLGLPYYSTVFPMRLSNGRVVILPVPANESPSTGENQSEFDVQEELCATNSLCLRINTKQFSRYDSVKDPNELSKRFSHCKALLESLKVKYIRVKELDEGVLKKDRGLLVKCAEGDVVFFLPKLLNSPDHHITSDSKSSASSKIKTENENVEENKQTDKEPVEYKNPDRYSYNEAAKELKSINEKTSKDQDISEHYDFKKETLNRKAQKADDDNHVEEDNDSKDKPSISETIPQEVHDTPTGDLNDISKSPANEILSNDKTPKEIIKRIDTSNVNDPILKEEKISDPTKSEDSPKETQNTKTNVGKDILTPDDKQTAIQNGNTGTVEEVESTETKSVNRRTPKTKNDESVELVSYRVNFMTKNSNGKVIKLRASGGMKMTESGNQIQNPQMLPSSNHGSKYDDHDGIKPGLVNSFTEDNEVNRIRHPESLEEIILMKENDCKELLQFGEQLLKHKMLSSLINLENHYNDCVDDLDELKKMYIVQHQLDVALHGNIFPLTLPSGVQKLVLLPTQFFKRDLTESLSSSNMNPDGVFKQSEVNSKTDQSENAIFKNRKPFDDPAFIPNDKFLESLWQGSASSDTSTLSKVASMLHMNGGHTEKVIAE